MAKVDVVTKEENKQQLTHIFLLLITVEGFVAFKFAPNVRQLLVHSFHFRLFTFACG